MVSGKARVDGVLATALRGIAQTEDYKKAREAIAVQLLDLWLTRINVNAVFTPSQKDALKLPRLCEDAHLKSVCVSSCLQVLMEMVQEASASDA